MAKPTRASLIKYLDSLGDSVDWKGWTLEAIKAEVIRGDEYDNMDIWGHYLEEIGASEA